MTQVIPGVGTVVANRPPAVAPRSSAPPATDPPRTPRSAPARGNPTAIDRERIVQAAIAIADDDGMAELSMRRIATELGVATMSLYRHVASKDELILHMIDAALGEDSFPPIAPDGWRARLELVARKEWAAFRHHPWLAPIMSLTRPQLAPNAVAVADRVLNAFDGTDLSPQDRLFIHLTVFSFVRGVATALEPEAEARRDTGLTNDEWMDTQEATLANLVPPDSLLLRLALTGDFDFSLDKLFEFGLGRLLDGIDVALNRSIVDGQSVHDG